MIFLQNKMEKSSLALNYTIIPSEARSLLGLGRDRMASMAISCVDFKTSPFLVNLNAGFFSAANNVKHGFLSSGTFIGSTWLQHR